MIELIGWATHQHYHRRHAPWIKQYVKALDDPTFRVLSHGARCLLNDLWLLGAGTDDGHIKLASTALAWRIREPAEAVAAWLTELAAVRGDDGSPRWIILHDDNGLPEMLAPREQDASKMLLQRQRRDRDRDRDRGEKEGGPAAEQLIARFSDPDHRKAVQGALRGARFPDSVLASIEAHHSGLHGSYEYAVIGQALVELQAAGTLYSAAALRKFCQRLVAGDTPRRAGDRQAKNEAVLDAYEQGAT